MARLNFHSLITTLLALSPLVAGDCGTFTFAKSYSMRLASESQNISKTVICRTPTSDYDFPDQERCSPSKQCPIAAYGVVNSIGTNNLSLTKEQVLPLYTLVNATKTKYRKPPTFFYSLGNHIEMSSSCVPAKRANETIAPAGYWIFKPSLVCVQGTLSQCNNGPVNDGTPIEICGVDTSGSLNTDLKVNGSRFFLADDADKVPNLTSNPAATISPVAREPSSTSTSAPSMTLTTSPSASPTAGAERVAAGGLLGGLAMGMLLVL